MSEEVEKATYEQCPYDWEYVSRIYRNIREEPPESVEWQILRSSHSGARFRRYAGYFQFFYGDSESSLYRELQALEPMQTTDDAEWDIEKHGEREYLVRSVFTRTFGPCAEQQRVDELIEPHGALLDCFETYVSGAATFSELTPQALLDACRRLVTLERYCIEANKQVTSLLNDYWSSVRGVIEGHLETGSLDLRAQEYGGKKRAPLEQDEA